MNKKIVFIIVIVECILAVLLISVFGQAIFGAVKKHLAEEVYFTYQDGTKIEDGMQLEVELTDSKRDYVLYWTVGPEETTNTAVRFTSSAPESVIVNESGVVTFFDDVKSVIITVTTLDGSNQTDVITLVRKVNVGGDVE